jgi:uncharacterized protein
MTTDTLVRQEVGTAAQPKLQIVDADVHPYMRSPGDLDPYLSERWQKHRKTYRENVRRAFTSTWVYPRMENQGNRLDAMPADGTPAGSNLDLMREQLLDLYNIEYGILQPLGNAGYVRNPDYSKALCYAMNEWQADTWVAKEPRLKASIVINPEYPDDAVAEIERCGTNPAYAQITLPPRAGQPTGNRSYWPIYEAAQHFNIPLGMHVGGINGFPSTSGGWPSFYIEEHHSNALTAQSVVTSLVLEGVFEEFPQLKVIMIEGGFAWVPSLSWRLDKHWNRMRDEVPHVKRPPSEYIKEHIWFSTQPMEEPPDRQDLKTLIDWIGWDRLLFATDYPHWDFDDPNYAFKFKMSDEQKQMIYAGNAKNVLRLNS